MLLLKGSLMRSVQGKNAEENDAESNNIVYTDNPLQNVSDTTNVETRSRVYELEIESANQKEEITDLKTENTDLKAENTDVKTKNNDLITENTTLQQKIRELESKGNDNNDESSIGL